MAECEEIIVDDGDWSWSIRFALDRHTFALFVVLFSFSRFLSTAASQID